MQELKPKPKAFCPIESQFYAAQYIFTTFDVDFLLTRANVSLAFFERKRKYNTYIDKFI